MKASIVVVLVLVGLGGAAPAERATRRPSATRRVALDTRVFAPHLQAAALRDRGSLVEQPIRWTDPEKPRVKPPWRPRVLALPLSSPTGGAGVKLKIRF